MARPRQNLSRDIRTALPDIKNFYFSPPSGKQLKYPCAVCRLVGDNSSYADNLSYIRNKEYTVTIIDEDPDSRFSDQLLDSFQSISLDRVFSSENLNHFVHTLYY